MTAPGTRLRALVVDDERPALDELVYLLSQDPRVGEVVTSGLGSAIRRGTAWTRHRSPARQP